MDGVKDGNETDVDCGGQDCDPLGKTCAAGKQCQLATDCSSGFCSNGTCALRPDGDGCTSPSQCLDGNCVGGGGGSLCCSSACSGPCQSCLSSQTGLANGILRQRRRQHRLHDRGRSRGPRLRVGRQRRDLRRVQRRRRLQRPPDRRRAPGVRRHHGHVRVVRAVRPLGRGHGELRRRLLQRLVQQRHHLRLSGRRGGSPTGRGRAPRPRRRSRSIAQPERVAELLHPRLAGALLVQRRRHPEEQAEVEDDEVGLPLVEHVALVAPARAHLDRGGAGPLAVALVDDLVAAEPRRLLPDVRGHHLAQRLAVRELVAGGDERQALAAGEHRVERVHRVVGEPVDSNAPSFM